MAQHKPGSLKQKNKKHKGKDGKRAQTKSMGAGKTNAVRKSSKSNAQKSISNKAERLNKNNQLKKIKRDNVWLQKRTGASFNSTSHSATKVIGILTLSDFTDSFSSLQECFRQLNVPLESLKEEPKTVYHAYDVVEKTNFTFVVPPNHLKRDLFFALELAKSVDIMMFAVDAATANGLTGIIDEIGLSTLSALKAMGCPDALFCVNAAVDSLSAMEDDSTMGIRKTGMGQSRKVVHQHIADVAMLPDARFVDIDSSCTSKSSNVLARMLRNMTPKPVSWRAQRSYLLADAASVTVESTADPQAQTCRVQLSGYLRGRPMPVHSLMHLVGVGAGRVVKVWQGQPPSAAARQQPFTAEGNVVVADKDKQDSLQMEAAGNGLMGEQTWPTEEELMMAGGPEEDGDRNAGRDRRVLQAEAMLPKGMSSYQADWFMDEEGQLDFSARSVGADAKNDGEGDGSSIGDDCEEFTLGGGTLSGKKSVAGSGFNSKGVPYTLKERQEADEAFPDEMDTPDDISARLRFARYRALLSFRSSPWHPKENLPQDYARIFQFEHFAGTQRRLLSESKTAEQLQLQAALEARRVAKNHGSGGSVSGMSIRENRKCSKASEEDMEMSGDETEEGDSEEEGDEMELGEDGNASRRGIVNDTDGFIVPDTDDYIQTGQYVCVELEDVPLLVAERLREYGFLLCHALYTHEQKLSVLHFHVQKHPSYTEPLKSKDELLFMVGFRSFMTKPVFSESNLNCDKHKFERFLLPDRFSMASCYGPTFVSTCPLLVFKRSVAGSSLSLSSSGAFRSSCGSEWSLVATGTLANVEPDRIMLKKIVLTGFPIRVRKRFAVVKHLFHEPQDVRWFKPAELVTKWGLRGHITEPVGTHGLLKALFNGAIKQNDTVMLVLYKRVYPKFPVAGLQLQ